MLSLTQFDALYNDDSAFNYNIRTKAQSIPLHECFTNDIRARREARYAVQEGTRDILTLSVRKLQSIAVSGEVTVNTEGNGIALLAIQLLVQLDNFGTETSENVQLEPQRAIQKDI